MKTMPRLIDDQRQRRRLTAISLFLLLACTVGVCFAYVQRINEQWRASGRIVLSALQDTHDWLSERTVPLRDATYLGNKSVEIGRWIENKDVISQADIDFLVRTRKSECMQEAASLGLECRNSLAEVFNVREKLSALSQEGTNLVLRMRKAAKSSSVASMSEACAEVLSTFSNLKQICDGRFVITPKFWSSVEVGRRVVSRVKARQAEDEEWNRIAILHEDYGAWVNSVSGLMIRAKDAKIDLDKKLQGLRMLPFDSINTYGQTIKEASDEIDQLGHLVSTGTFLCNTLGGTIDERLSELQASAQKDVDDLCGLRETHGDYVNVNIFASATNVYLRLLETRQTALANIRQRCSIIRVDILRATDVKSRLMETLVALRGADSKYSEEAIVKKCEEGLRLVQDLKKISVGLVGDIDALTNFACKTQSVAVDGSNEISKCLADVRRSLLNWEDEGRGIVASLVEISSGFLKMREDLAQIRKTLFYYQDVDGCGDVAYFRKRMVLASEDLTNIEKECASAMPSSNGRELSMLLKKKEDILNRVSGVANDIKSISNDFSVSVRVGRLCAIKFFEYSNALSTELHQGKRNFNFALDIPAAGHHNITICFKKGGRYLFKTSPNVKHKVILRCVVSGAADRDVDVLWVDSTAYQDNRITFDGDFEPGINVFNLGLTFSAVGSRDAPLPLGEWQFLYSSNGFWESSQQNNFEVEFWVDEVKSNVLWSVPAQ